MVAGGMPRGGEKDVVEASDALKAALKDIPVLIPVNVTMSSFFTFSHKAFMLLPSTAMLLFVALK